MFQSLAQADAYRHAPFMAVPSQNLSDMKLLGEALTALRLEAGLSQKAAGEAAKPPMSSQAWGLNETGKIKAILTPDGQRRLASAIGRTVEDLHLAKAKIENGHAAAPRGPRVGGLADRSAPEFSMGASTPHGMRRFVIPLATGEAMLSYPSQLSPAAAAQLCDHLEIFLRGLRPLAATDAP